MSGTANNIHELPSLHDRTLVFPGRAQAGDLLAEMLSTYRNTDTVVFGIPAGGIPVAAQIALQLNLTLDVTVVSKITLPWNTESGYGAVAFDGSLLIDDDYVAQCGLSDSDVLEGIRKTTVKVKHRLQRFRGQQLFPDLSRRPAILVDDGLASGSTMRVAVAAMRKQGVKKLIVAVPTGHNTSVETLAAEVEALYCANIRGGFSFAVADAYEQWTDVGEEEVMDILNLFPDRPHIEDRL